MALLSTQYITETQDLGQNWLPLLYVVDATAGNITLTLPNIDSDGLCLQFKRIDITYSQVVVQGKPGQAVAGQPSQPLNALPGLKLVSFHGNWHIL